MLPTLAYGENRWWSYCTMPRVSAEYLAVAIAIEERWRYRTFQCIFYRVWIGFPSQSQKFPPHDLGKAEERVHFSMPELA